ncbi:hypothetical protein HD554DRAFT_2316305 [Boletus coccyginus]|nr:hypothetical protein HD554DRAFT_2316305 [Boletus coccyginus]
MAATAGFSDRGKVRSVRIHAAQIDSGSSHHNLSRKTMEALSPFNQQRHVLLEAFRRDVWGNPSIFVQKSESPHRPGQTVEYLNLEGHLAAVQLFCGALMRKELLVIQEYRNAMDKFKSNDLSYKNGACITGQPGIGKSIFVAYAVIERLREKQPVAVEIAWGDLPGAYVLFSKHGVGIHDHSDSSLNAYVPDIWPFSDSTVVTPIPTPAFLVAPYLRVFQTIYPAQSCWRHWTKERQVKLYIMDLWTVEEIKDLVFISKLGDNDAERIRTLLDRWGPVPDTLMMSLVDNELDMLYEITVNRAVRLAMRDLDTVIRPVTNLDNILDESGSSTIFFVRPLKEENIIYRKLGRYQAAEQAEFFRKLCIYSNARSVAGRIFEEVVHEFLVGAKSIFVHWYAEDGTSVIELPQASSDVLTTRTDFNPLPPFYWRPDNANDQEIDGALVTNDHFYVIRTTIGHKNSTPQDSVDNLWRSMPQDKQTLKWKMLFIGPVETQTREVSAPYARGLAVGGIDSDTKGREHLPVGWFSLFSNVPGWYALWGTVQVE